MTEDAAGQRNDRNGDSAAATPIGIREIAQGVFSSASFGENRAAPTFELKFRLLQEQAHAVAAWAAQHLQPDPHADGDGAYLVHELYFDTPALDVFHRSPGYKKRKYRLRRYGDNDAIFLEQKRKTRGRVAKRRVQVAPSDLEHWRENPLDLNWTGCWFLRRITRRLLAPSCLISYERHAFVGHNPDGPLRLTLDRNVRARPAATWQVAPVLDGLAMFPDQVLLEVKYRKHLPAVFKALIQDFSLTPVPVSKYRLAVASSGRTTLNGRSPDA